MTDRKRPVALAWTIMWLGAVSVLNGLGPGGAAWAQGPDSKASPPGSPTVESVLRKTAEFYAKAKSIVVEVERSQKLGPLTMQITASVAFQRPNRLAVHQKGTMPGIDLVSDGKTMFVSIPALQKYSEGEAPATIDALTGDPFAQAALQFLMIGELCAADPYAKLMVGVKTATYAGQETLDGVKTRRRSPVQLWRNFSQ